MLSLDNLTWTIPGICFLFSYNRLRDVESLEFSGWPFVFFIVLIGAITKIPLEHLFDTWNQFEIIALASTIAFFIPFVIKFLFEFFIKRLEADENFFIKSNLWSIIYFFYPLENKDKFIKNCIENEGEPVLVTTEEDTLVLRKNINQSTKLNELESPEKKKNSKEEEKIESFSIKSRVFFGILVEFPYVATKVTDSQVIRILPLLSGYRYIENEKEKIQWTQKYEINKDSVGVIISRNKILNFSPYIKEDHESLVFEDKS